MRGSCCASSAAVRRKVAAGETVLDQKESVPAILETAASGEVAEIFADIRATLNTSVVNLIWRHLATMPGALPWAWSTLRPLYLGPAIAHAEAVRRTLTLPAVPPLSRDALAAAAIDPTALANIRTILRSYHHTNALALAILSALLERYDPTTTDPVHPAETISASAGTKLPPLPPMADLPGEVQRLIQELNGYGEDGAPDLIASMYRHLSYWPPYLALVRTMLAPLQADGSLNALTRSARTLGRAHGRMLAGGLAPGRPPDCLPQALAACRLFVEHPIARMTGICAIIRHATPE
jgi:hypothetical protein